MRVDWCQLARFVAQPRPKEFVRSRVFLRLDTETHRGRRLLLDATKELSLSVRVFFCLPLAKKCIENGLTCHELHEFARICIWISLLNATLISVNWRNLWLKNKDQVLASGPISRPAGNIHAWSYGFQIDTLKIHHEYWPVLQQAT